MFKTLKMGGPAWLLPLLLPMAAWGQTITTGAAPVSNVPVNNPLVLGLLVAALVIAGTWVMRRGDTSRNVISLLLFAAFAAAGGHGSNLMAQVLSAFTNPAGETKAITVSPLTAGGFTGFAPADFTNNAGQALKITALVQPNYAQCYATNPANTLQPAGAPLPSPPPACNVGSLLGTGSTCRVDVEAICRALIPSQALASVSPSSGTASGVLGVTLTGSGLTGATAVTFDGVAATFVNVVSDTMVTAVTPAHATGSVDVVLTTPSGAVTLTNGFTYLTTAVGQSSGGGTIAALNGGLNNLIAAAADNGTAVEWATTNIPTPSNANSTTDGAANTAELIRVLGVHAPAARLCSAYEVDSQGNTPCQAGNACYSDWFLPAGNNATASGQLNALYTNRVAIGGFAGASYWSSTVGSLGASARAVSFVSGSNSSGPISRQNRVRCVRNFTP